MNFYVVKHLNKNILTLYIHLCNKKTTATKTNFSILYAPLKFGIIHKRGEVMSFSNKLQKLRIARELSQFELAKKLAVDISLVENWENGQAYPDTAKVIEISKLFGVTIDYLLGEEEIKSAEVHIIEKADQPTMSDLSQKRVKVAVRFTVVFMSICLIIAFASTIYLYINTKKSRELENQSAPVEYSVDNN